MKIVNGKTDLSEKLFGLSHSAIKRWAMANQIEFSSEIIRSLSQISSDLFFIATRSQDPVGSDYKLRCQKIINSVSSLERVLEMNEKSHGREPLLGASNLQHPNSELR
ncbi:MAG: hypothetical protein OXC62_01260 [Aestuariivita sp.]|nr:hypothetical protein [Aestuariivita sp.]